MTPALFNLGADGTIRERPRTYVTMNTDDGVRLDTLHTPEDGPYAVIRRAHFTCTACDALERDAIHRAGTGQPDMRPQQFPGDDSDGLHYAIARRFA